MTRPIIVSAAAPRGSGGKWAAAQNAFDRAKGNGALLAFGAAVRYTEGTNGKEPGKWKHGTF